MSSREIAKLTGKEHRNVKRDIDAMAKELNLNRSNLSGSEYTYRGNTYTEYNLDKNLTLTLISGYNVKLRNTIVTRWDELEVENKELVAQLEARDDSRTINNEIQNPSYEQYYLIVGTNSCNSLGHFEARRKNRLTEILTSHLTDNGVGYMKNSFNYDYFGDRDYGESIKDHLTSEYQKALIDLVVTEQKMMLAGLTLDVIDMALLNKFKHELRPMLGDLPTFNKAFVKGEHLLNKALVENLQ